jgi:hypothetical protein
MCCPGGKIFDAIKEKRSLAFYDCIRVQTEVQLYNKVLLKHVTLLMRELWIS